MTTDPNQALDGATTALQRQVAELTEQLQKTAQPPDYAEARAALNEAPALQRRIEELTAELERVRVDLRLQQSCFIQASDELATERAARERLQGLYEIKYRAHEQAERERDVLNDKWQEKTTELVKALDERDTALALAQLAEARRGTHACPGVAAVIAGTKPAPSAEPEWFCLDCGVRKLGVSYDGGTLDGDDRCTDCGWPCRPLVQLRTILSRAGLAIVKASDVPSSETWQDKHMKLATQMQQLTESVASMPCAECARRAAKEGKSDG